MGEFFLAQFHDSFVAGMGAANNQFVNMYELGSFLFKWFPKNHAEVDNLGDVKALLELLKRLNMGLDRPKALQCELEKLDFDATTKQYAEFKLTGSTYIMIHFLTSARRDLADTIAGAMEAVKSQHRDNLVRYRVRVMASAIVWLDEIFAPFVDWHRRFRRFSVTRSQKEGLKWLGQTEMREILDGKQLSEDKQDMLKALWKWFEVHPDDVVKLVFKISKLGLFRDSPKELDLLWKIFSSYLNVFL
jgi:hypothetical protein